METVRQAMAALAAKIEGDPAFAKEVGPEFELQIEGQGGGAWSMTAGTTPSFREGLKVSEVGLSMSVETFMALLKGELNPQEACLNGALKIKGRVAQAITLYKIFDPAIYQH
jgi:putative sterol carrier protein